MKIKTYQDWLVEREGTGTLMEDILSQLEPTIERLLEQARKSYEERFDRPMTAWDETITRLQMTYDLSRSIEAYVLPTDRLISLKAQGSPKGSIVIEGTISRDGVEHDLSTSVIYAGGYNIQRLHYRYLTKTTLPKTGQEEESKRLLQEIKTLSKGEKINNEIARQHERIKGLQDLVAAAEAKTPAQIEAEIMASDMGRYLQATWQDLIARGADKNYPGGEAEFQASQREELQRAIDRWNKTNIDFRKRDIRSAEAEISKLTKKLEGLIK